VFLIAAIQAFLVSFPSLVLSLTKVRWRYWRHHRRRLSKGCDIDGERRSFECFYNCSTDAFPLLPSFTLRTLTKIQA
jgi:hypothetical protein